MRQKSLIVSRREVVAGIGGLAALVAARPVMAQAPSGTPIRIGQALALTGPFAQTGLIHKIVSEYYVERLNKNGGLLGRPVEYVLYDDQSKPDVSRTLYEKLITADKVDLILAPYGTASILAAMGVAARYNKVYIQNTMGVPALAKYKWHFSALVSGPDPSDSLPNKILDCYASTGNPPKTAAVVTSKFPSAEDMAKGMRDVAAKRGLKEVAFLEYETGNLDYGPLAARIKEADPDYMFVGCLGIEGNQLLEALSKVGYTPKRHFYLYPAPVLAGPPAAEHATSLTNFEDVAPFTTPPEAAEFARAYDAKAVEAKLPYPHVDSQAGNEYCGWQILVAAVNGAKSIEDAKMAAFLDTATVDTLAGKRNFKGLNHTSETDQQEIRQVQSGKWVSVFPTNMATPGTKLLAP
ncbi:MAG TPA: amino acid ABC transporter substrate-binding protein [Stellaceae bacterium]|jgi:branched-chain amino acid transport system substrate-binding protein|nr:amino acid ABC transporter substrate-binding protein [Stellaceae bacterium]